MKEIFKFFGNRIGYAHALNIRHFLLICGAIINKYYGLIEMRGATVELAREMRSKRDEVNVVQALVEQYGLKARRGRWIRLSNIDLPSFPRLTLDELSEFTFGCFQLRLAPSYIQDNLQDSGEAEYQLDHLREPGLIRIRVRSRFRNATRHQLWIAFVEPPEDEEDEEHTPIQGYYCTCQSGARTIGCCCHVAAVIWFLSYARFEDGVRYPSQRLLDKVQNVMTEINVIDV